MVVVLAAALGASGLAWAAGSMSSGMPTAGGGMSSSVMAHMERPPKAAWIPFAPALPTRGWKVTASSSVPGHGAAAVLGKNGSAYWQSARLSKRVRLPQSLTIMLPSRTVVSGLSATPRSGRSSPGLIGRFRVTLSTDGVHFGAPVAYGRWSANATVKKVGFQLRTVRAVRLTALSLASSSDRAVAVARIVLAGRPKGVRTVIASAAAAASAATVGSWGATIGLPIIPVAAALVPGNRLILWSADEAASMNFDGSNASPYTQTAVLDLTTGQVTGAAVSNTAHDMFCPGVSILTDGKVLVTGGISNTLASIYDPTTNSWTSAKPMNIPRAYQGQTTLSDGQAFVLGGSWSGHIGGKEGEVWSPTANWRELPGVPADPTYTADAEGVFRADNHGWFIATSGGRVFQAGPSKTMHWITTNGAGTITSAGARGTSPDEMNGNAVLYDVNKILTVGGAPSYQNSNAVKVANTINISSTSPKVTSTAAMSNARAFANSVALPTGDVLTVGGQNYAVPFSDQTSVLTPELWGMSTGRWTAMAPGPEPRNYHSVAVLLPDGRVFSGGGGLCGTCATNHPDGQIFSPPYLFNSDGSLRTRPRITSSPSAAQNGQTISVTTNTTVKSFVLMRYGEATHTVDNDQRRIPLAIVSTSGTTYKLTIPSDSGVALPGPYLVFALNSAGTPSVAATIFIKPPAASRPDAYGTAVVGDRPAIYWPLSDSAGSTTAADQSGNRNNGDASASGITFGTPSPVETSSGSGIRIAGGPIVSTQPQGAPNVYSEALWFNTTSSAGGLLATFGDGATGHNGDQDRGVWMTPSGQIEFGVWTGQAVTIRSPGSYIDGKWHFVVATQGADGMHLYLDGQQVASDPTNVAQNYMGYWQLGGISNDWPDSSRSPFNGSLSDAAMFNSELTLSQIQKEYSASPVSQAPSSSGTPPYVSAVLATSPSSYWSLGDPSGSATAADLSGNGAPGNYSATGVTYGVPSPVEGSNGRGVTLDGASGRVIASRWQPAPTVYSAALWFKTTTTQGGALAAYGDVANGPNNDQDRQIWVTPSGQIEFGVWTGQTVTIRSPGSYNDGNWHFVVATEGADGMHLYLDGQQVGSNANTQAQAYGGYWQVGIGVNPGWPDSTTTPYAGSLSDVALYSGTELTAAQIQTLFAAG